MDIDGKMPVARYYHSACVLCTGSRPILMVAGGMGGLGRMVLSDVWLLDVTNKSWNEVYMYIAQ